MTIVMLAFLIAFVSATQDIAFDAYRTDTLFPSERGLGSAVYIFAFRMAMLTSGGLALICADFLGWRVTYEIMALLIGLCSISTFFAPESSRVVESPHNLKEAVFHSFKDLFQRESIFLILLFIVFYKAGDAMALSLMSNFLLHGLGFSLTDVGIAYKTMGLLATIIGAFVGGALLTKINLYRALLLFGLAQGLSNAMFMFLAMAGKSYFIMVSAIFIESFCSGMSTAAFVAFLMSLCNSRYSATQFACLSALASVGRVFLGPLAGIMVKDMGWVSFYGWTVVLSLAGIGLLGLLRRRVIFNAEAII
jgi:PAT family beta-lactamase induction signal transducer AmpG